MNWSNKFLMVLFSLCMAGLLIAGCTTQTTTTPVEKTVPAVVTTGAVSSAPASLTGTWKANDGQMYVLTANNSVQQVTVNENTWVIKTQKGPVISGYKTFISSDGSLTNETLLGVIDPDGKTVYFIDQPGGWAKGTLTDPNTMFIALVNPGSGMSDPEGSIALTMTLHRTGS